MYKIIKNVIESKRYELNEMLRKIDIFWLQDDITEEQKNKLEDMARANADMTKTMNVFKILADHDERLRSLEENKPVEKPAEEYPEFQLNHQYRNGDKVAEKGKHYICTAPEGVVCVWSPTDYPAYWKEVA